MELRSVTLTWEIFGFWPHHHRAVVPCGCGSAFCQIRKSATSNVTEAIADYRYSNLRTEIPDFDDFYSVHVRIRFSKHFTFRYHLILRVN